MKAARAVFILLVSLWLAASAHADDNVVTIYFAGTSMTREMWQASASKFGQPETVATLYHFQKVAPAYANHYNGFVDGFDKWDLLPDWPAHNALAASILDRVPACAGQCITLNLVGFSRGGVSALAFAKWVLGGVQGGPWPRVESIKRINILAFDPVPGDQLNLNSGLFNLPANVEYIGFYAVDERSAVFGPVFPAPPAEDTSNPPILFFKVPGSHETLVGSIYRNGHRATGGVLEDLRSVSRTLRTVATEILGSSEWGHVRFNPYPADDSLNLDWCSGETDIDLLRQRFLDGLNSIYGSGIDYRYMREFSFVQAAEIDIRESWYEIWPFGEECRNAPTASLARNNQRCVYYRTAYSGGPLGEGNTYIGAVSPAVDLDRIDDDYVIWDLIAQHGCLDVDGDRVDYHEDNCPTAANPDQTDSDGDSVGNSCDNCRSVFNPTQDDLDENGRGDSCDLMIVLPRASEVLDCGAGATPPTISWLPTLYDKYKVFIGRGPSFAQQISSGDTLLQSPSWTVPLKKWRTACGWPGSSLYIKVKGVDADVSRIDPERKIFSSVITVGKQR